MIHISTHRTVIFAAGIASILAISACTSAPAVPETPLPTLECGRLTTPNATRTSCAPLPTAEVDSQAVEFPSKRTPGGLITLRGTITRPRWTGAIRPPQRLPAIVLLHGSGPQSRDGVAGADLKGTFSAPVPLLKEVAHALSSMGFIVLRYDKRTCTSKVDAQCQYPVEIAAMAGWEDLVGDAEAAANFLRSRPAVDSKDLLLLGHSQGATIALVAGKEIKPSGYVLLSGLFQSVDKALARQIQWQFEAKSNELTNKQRTAAQNQIAEINSGMLAIREGYWPDEELLLGARGKFWKQWIDAGEKTTALLQSSNTPILYLWGEDDENAARVDFDGFTQALRGRTGSAAIALPGLSHAMHDRAGSAEISPKAVEALSDWLQR